MRYYVVADVHGFYTELIAALTEKGFFEDKEPHKLIVCGDLFDRGLEAVKLQNFIVDLINKDEVILIRGNHEDLALELIKEWDKRSYLFGYHNSNGTVNTVLQLTNEKIINENNCDEIKKRLLNTPFIKKLSQIQLTTLKQKIIFSSTAGFLVMLLVMVVKLIRFVIKIIGARWIHMIGIMLVGSMGWK